MAFFQWSKTASANATADPTINLAEGMSPSSVNDSNRAMMARAADWRDDISGTITTTGTGTALVMASNQVFDTTAHMDGAMLAFIPNITNTGAVTLAVDGLTPKPIRSQTGSGGNLGAGVLILGTPYIVTYDDGMGEFILQGFVGQPYAVPLGSFLFHSVATVPNSNFVMPIGQAISRTTYAAYFAMVGTTFGVGDGITTFNVPDLRSRMPIPLATMGGSDPGRITTAGSGIDGATVGAVGGAQNVTLDTTMIPSHTHTIIDPGHTHTYTEPNSATVGISGGPTPTVFNRTAGVASGSNTTGISAQATGGGLAHNNMPPGIVLPVILRVL